MSEFRFPLKDVKENGRLDVDANARPETFPDALSEGALLGPVALTGTILAVDDEASFTGSAKGKWRFECARCLKPIEEAWSAPIEAMVPIDGGPMDLTDEVRQSIALAEPMMPLCRPDCKGLCGTCKGNRNEKDCGHPQETAPEAGSGGMRKPRLTHRHRKG